MIGLQRTLGLLDGKPVDRPPFHPIIMRWAARYSEIREFRRRVGERYFIVGWVEGPVAEYADLRGVSNAALDFMDEPDAVLKAIPSV